jgi:hypothetical protein
MKNIINSQTEFRLLRGDVIYRKLKMKKPTITQTISQLLLLLSFATLSIAFLFSIGVQLGYSITTLSACFSRKEKNKPAAPDTRLYGAESERFCTGV